MTSWRRSSYLNSNGLDTLHVMILIEKESLVVAAAPGNLSVFNRLNSRRAIRSSLHENPYRCINKHHHRYPHPIAILTTKGSRPFLHGDANKPRWISWPAHVYRPELTCFSIGRCRNGGLQNYNPDRLKSKTAAEAYPPPSDRPRSTERAGPSEEITRPYGSLTLLDGAHRIVASAPHNPRIHSTRVTPFDFSPRWLEKSSVPFDYDSL